MVVDIAITHCSTTSRAYHFMLRRKQCCMGFPHHAPPLSQPPTGIRPLDPLPLRSSPHPVSAPQIIPLISQALFPNPRPDFSRWGPIYLQLDPLQYWAEAFLSLQSRDTHSFGAGIDLQHRFMHSKNGFVPPHRYFGHSICTWCVNLCYESIYVSPLCQPVFAKYFLLDPAAHGRGAQVSRERVRESLCMTICRQHIIIRNPRIKRIQPQCLLRTDQISPRSQSETKFLGPDSGVSTVGAGLT